MLVLLAVAGSAQAGGGQPRDPRVTASGCRESYTVVRGAPYMVGIHTGVSRCTALRIGRAWLTGRGSLHRFRCHRGRYSPVVCLRGYRNFFLYTESE